MGERWVKNKKDGCCILNDLQTQLPKIKYVRRFLDGFCCFSAAVRSLV